MSDITNPYVAGNTEVQVENSLRPKSFDDIIGRRDTIETLRIMIGAAQQRNEPLDHMIFFGPPGLGKTSIASVVAKEMGVPIYITSGPALERQGDLASILTSIEDKGILFIDEIHRLNKTVEEILYPAMEDRAIDLVIGKGPSAKTLRLELGQFTLVGATTKMGKLGAPLRDRFGATYRFDFYDFEDITKIVYQKAKILGVEIDEDAAEEIGRRSRRTPRIAIRILKRLRDFAQIHNDGLVSMGVIEKGLNLLNVDELGLDYIDRKLLGTIIESFDGGPVGLGTLAASLAEEVETIEDVCEPFLLREGLIKRTARGRVITQKGINHIQKTIDGSI
jgi:holliday junction DNA helicase RuvB